MYGEATLVNSCSHKWRHRFSDGKMSSKDDTRSGSLVTQTTEEKCAAVVILMEKRQGVVGKVSEEFDFSTAQEILTSKLEFKRDCARLVPRLLHLEQKIQICHDLTSRYAEERDGFLNIIVTCITSLSLKASNRIPCGSMLHRHHM